MGMATTADAPTRICPECRCPLTIRDVTCPVCAGRRQRKGKLIAQLGIVGAVLVGIAAVGVGGVKYSQARKRAADPYQNIRPKVEGPLPQPPQVKARTPKSLNDLQIRKFTLQKKENDFVSIVVGDIENVSENLHRNVQVELEIFDAQGLQIDTLHEFIVELPANQTWHVVSKTLDPRAASVRVGGIKEDK